ncbi:MAG: phosphoserine phosphatase SerB [Alphaproteobacteria bacterium]
MTAILTFVAANPDQTPLTEAHFEAKGSVEWIEDAKAARVQIETPLSREEIAALRDDLNTDKIDIFQRSADAKPIKLLLADMDSTIVAEETLDELAAFAGLKNRVAEITAKAMNGELDFHGAVRERVSLLKGLSTNALQETLAATIVNPGAKELVAAIKAQGGTCVLVSGGFTNFTAPIAQQVGFDHNHGNTLGIDGDTLSGEVIPPILDKTAKVKFLDEYCTKLGIDASQAMTIGDGANDLPMLLKAQNAGGFGVGYHAKPSVEAELINSIRHGDLAAAIYGL